MAHEIGGKLMHFRETFRLPNKDILRWFPGHMGKGIKQMEKNLKNVDCLIEVHDSRVPISGRYVNFKKTLCGLKPHILVLSKTDLTDKHFIQKAVEKLNKESIHHIIQTNLKDETCNENKLILPLVQNLVQKSNRYNRSQENNYSIMVIGVPNVGKSSLINRLRNIHLRKGKAAKVAPEAGCTRSLMNKIKICEKPSIYLFDTPGILPPYIPDFITGLKLALVGCSLDHLIGPELLADFLLYWLNKNNNFKYVEVLKLKEPSDNIIEVLIQVSVKINKIKKVKNIDNGGYKYIPDLHLAAEYFIKAFRNGELGLYCLDQDILQ